MPNIQLEALSRFRRYQRLLVFGGGVLTTIMLLLTFLLEARSTALRHLESLRQAFSAEHAVLQKEIDARENAFRIVLVGAEIIWREGVPFDISHVHDYRRQGRQLLLESSSALRPQWVFGAGGARVDDEGMGRFFSLAVQVGRATSVDRMVKGEVLSSYFYSLRHNIAGIIPAPDHDARQRIAADRDRYLHLLTRDVDQRIFWPAEREANDGQQPLYWLPPHINPYTGQRVLRIAGPIHEHGVPFAALVMEYAPPNLSENFLPGETGGAYAILSERGEVISSTAADLANADDLDPQSLERLAQQAGSKRVELYQGGMLTIADTLNDTGWLLVFRYSWFDFVSVMIRQLGLEMLMTVSTLLLVWCALIYFKLCIFRPLIRRSQRVFESEQLSRTLIETAPVGLGLLVVDTGEPLLRSPAMIQMQARVRSNLPDELARHYRQHVSSATLDEPGLIHEDLTFETRDGQPVNLAVSMAPVRYRGHAALVAAFIDITDKKRLERRLLEAKEAADKASAAKSSFLAAMSHEIRTPLNAILGNLELLAYSVEDSQRDRLETIRRSSDSLLAIVSDVLDFSKIEAGELSLERIEFDILEVVSDALAIFAPTARAKGLALFGELGDAATQPVRGDPTRLAQIINNLLSNAIKFTEHGQITLRLAVDRALGRIHLEVEDTGIGMSEAQVEQAFREFSQTDATINRRYGGTGLGLTLCKRLTESMGGELSVRSILGQGSIFRLSIPSSTDVGVADHPMFAAQEVLLVAAEPSCQDYLAEVLSSWWLRVSSFQHPAQLSDDILATADVLVIWGDRSTWHADDEKRLVEAAAWVIDCNDNGPSDPTACGRLISASIYGLQGLVRALRYILQGEALAVRDQQRPALPNRLRVLVAEDNPVNRRLFEEQLQLLGCVVRLVEDGGKALAWLEQESFDVLLTDLSMPVLDGYALARQARTRWPQMPVVAATAHVTLQEQEQCRAAGIVRIVTKPLSLAALEKALREVCGLAAGTPVFTRDADSGLLGGQDLPEDMRETFERFCIGSFAAIRQARLLNDKSSLLRELHALKGALGVYRLSQEARGLAEIETRIKAGESQAFSSLEGALTELEQKLLLQGVADNT